MTTKPASIVTKERYVKGLTYEQFLAQAKVNLDRFKTYYETAKMDPDDVAFFMRAKAAGLDHVLALGEDWCPDVFRGLPQIAKFAEATGLDLRIFPRDTNLDIMNEFLKDGQFQSIPTLVFYTKDHQYIGHWIERPQIAYKQRPEIEAEVRKAMPGASDQDIRKAISPKVEALYPAWQQASVKEWRELVASKLKVK